MLGYKVPESAVAAIVVYPRHGTRADTCSSTTKTKRRREEKRTWRDNVHTVKTMKCIKFSVRSATQQARGMPRMTTRASIAGKQASEHKRLLSSSSIESRSRTLFHDPHRARPLTLYIHSSRCARTYIRVPVASLQCNVGIHNPLSSAVVSPPILRGT